MLGLCFVEVSPHSQGMPLAAFSISSGIAAGRSDACCSSLTDEVTEGLDRNGAAVGRTNRLPETLARWATCPVREEVDKDRDEVIRSQQGGRWSHRRSQVPRRMDQAYQDELARRISDEFRMQKSGEGQADENQPGYRERFGLICQNVETEEWCAQGDDFSDLPSGNVWGWEAFEFKSKRANR